MTAVEFKVLGTPKPQGSKRHVGNGVMVESGGQALRTWREDVKHAAAHVRAVQLQHRTLAGPLAIEVTFLLARPKSHYRAGASTSHLLRDAAPDFPSGRPDLDKLLRSTFDAIGTAGLWADDAAAVSVTARKVYATRGHTTGAHIRIESLGDDQ